MEFLAEERWIVSCWHRAHATRDGADETREFEPDDHASLVAEVTQRWVESPRSTAGDLGLMVLHELARTYTHSRRIRHAWHDQWELDFFKNREKTETETLLRMRGLIAVFKEHLEALHRPGMSKNRQRMWFAHVTDPEEATSTISSIGR